MNARTIMAKIESGLTGDRDRDAHYLYRMVEQYQDSEYAEEIARGCADLLRQMIPEEGQKTLDLLMKMDQEVNEALMDAQKQMSVGHMKEARQILDAAVKKVESYKLYQDTTGEEYRTFEEPFEQALYLYRSGTKRRIQRADESLQRLYFLYGYLLAEHAEMGKARAMLKKAQHFNPVSASIGLQIADTYKQEGKLNRFAKETMGVFRNAFKEETIAACLRNLAYFFAEKGFWQESYDFNLLSLTFDENDEETMHELDYVSNSAREEGLDLHQPKPEDFAGYEKRYGFLTHADPDVIGIAWSTGKHDFEEGNARSAAYFLTIVYSLTHDEEAKAMLDRLGPVKDGQ